MEVGLLILSSYKDEDIPDSWQICICLTFYPLSEVCFGKWTH